MSRMGYSGRWFGPQHAYERHELGGTDGFVSESGRWFSDRWWSGHFFGRSRCGQFGHGDGACRRPRGHQGKHDTSRDDVLRKLYPSDYSGRRPASRSVRKTESQRRDEEARTAYRSYVEGRQSAAESATRGNMLSPAGKRAGARPSSFFNGRRPNLRYASEELRDWLRANGPTLSQTDYIRQARGGSSSRRSRWFDAA